MDSLVVSHGTLSRSLGLALPVQLEAGSDVVTATRLRPEERDAAILRCIQEIVSTNVKVSGQHRKAEWDSGWGEHRGQFEANGVQGLIPGYFTKHPYARINGEFAKSPSPLLELRLLRLLQDVLGYTFLAGLDFVVEFGCGTGHNLIHAYNTYASSSRLLGFDWAESSQRLLGQIATSLTVPLEGKSFNYFEPDSFSPLPPQSGVMTMCSLEQVGGGFEDFVRYLLTQQPAIVVHIEPMQELLDSSRLMDWVSIQYARKREYLDGFLPFLQTLQDDGRIEIVMASRSGVGSFLIDGYQVCVWRPING